ncbi:hypothetical protein D3C77_166470 [compost metagenome]
MPWYRQGTVAITAGQTTVTGTGTEFSANARVGDAFQGPDGRWYEVTNIASATALSILPAYQGATVASGAYGLAPMQGYVKESADRLRQLVAQFGGTLALLGNAADAGQLLSNIGAAASGSNNDITSLGGMTTALSVAQGGTGGKTPAEARAGLELGTAATAALGPAIGQVPTVGMYGIGAVDATPAATINVFHGGFLKITPATEYSTAIGINYGTILSVPYSQAENRSAQLFFGQLPSSTLKFRSGNLASDPIYTIYHTGNTTRAADGTLKAI